MKQTKQTRQIYNFYMVNAIMLTFNGDDEESK